MGKSYASLSWSATNPSQDQRNPGLPAVSSQGKIQAVGKDTNRTFPYLPSAPASQRDSLWIINALHFLQVLKETAGVG